MGYKIRKLSGLKDAPDIRIDRKKHNGKRPEGKGNTFLFDMRFFAPIFKKKPTGVRNKRMGRLWGKRIAQERKSFGRR